MEKGITFVGLDAHKVAINVAMLLPGKTVAVEWECWVWLPCWTNSREWCKRDCGAFA